MYATRWVYASLIALLVIVAVPGCEREGPAEEAGERVDRTLEEAGEAAEEAGEDAQ